MTGGTVSLTQVLDWLARFRNLVTEQRSYLTELDSAIGDADHGVNMTRGMDAVIGKIGAIPASAADELFKTVGMTLVTSVGGASGPLYGTFFLRMGPPSGAVTSIGAETFAEALRAGLGGIVARGKAEIGDKTMFDAMKPAVDAIDASLAAGDSIGVAARAAYDAALVGRDSTIPLQARKGRASYLGERSIGHLDPGATSTALLFKALADSLS